jgi:NADP-dependent 3-hydroxy acid dehydrogenase YdfG
VNPGRRPRHRSFPRSRAPLRHGARRKRSGGRRRRPAADLPITLDVRKHGDIDDALAAIAEELGTVSTLVNNAGALTHNVGLSNRLVRLEL